MNWKNVFRTLFLPLLCVVMLASCSDDEDSYSDYPTKIMGTWIVTSHGGGSLPHNERSINIFKSNGKQVYASNYSNEEGTRWVVEHENNYRLEGNVLYESGTDWEGKEYSSKSRIRIEGDIMYVSELELIENGEQLETGSYMMHMVTVEDYELTILGTWKGRETTPGVESAHDVYWHYMEDGTFDYYYYDEAAQEYVVKSDNEGKYFLYGDFMATNFKNNILTGGQNRESECWTISINGNRMAWYAWRADGTVATFEMERVESTPVRFIAP